MKKKTYSQLEQVLINTQASDIGNLSSAKKNIRKAGDNLMASACIIKITGLSGNVICDSFAIHDGLSPATIEAIITDIERTINLRLTMAGLKHD